MSLAAGVYVYFIAIEGHYKCPAVLAGTGGRDVAPAALLSTEEWMRLRGLSPASFSARWTPLLRPHGPGDNQQVGGNRMHALARPAPGQILPQDAFDLVEQTGAGMKVRF